MEETAPKPEPPTPPARILIVDADSGALEALSDSVTDVGHTVCHAAAPGRPALDLPAGATPDLALNGLEAGDVAMATIETAEQIAKRFGVPIVYATDSTDAALLERTERTEPHGYVLKSADSQQLGLTLLAALRMAARPRHLPLTDRVEPGSDALWNSAIVASLVATRPPMTRAVP